MSNFRYRQIYVPEEFEIRCPRCNGLARVDAPFAFFSAPKRIPFPDPVMVSRAYNWLPIKRNASVGVWGSPRAHSSWAGRPEGFTEGVPNPQETALQRWGHWMVVEKYPSIVRWSPPRSTNDFYDMRPEAIVKCTKCHLVDMHEVAWPEDAYFRWDIRGQLLWAWSTEHAQAILGFISGTSRNEAEYVKYARWLLRLPKKVLSARVRDLVVKEISATLKDG